MNGAAKHMVHQSKNSLDILIVAGRTPSFDASELNVHQRNYQVIGQVESIAQALQIVEQRPIHIILADSTGPGVTDTSWIQRLSIQSPNTLVLVTATSNEMDFIREAMLAGAKGFLLKPFDTTELARSIDQVYQLWQQRQDNLNLSDVHDQHSKTEGNAKCLAVFSPKGGTGATTLAVNLAIALRQETAEPVLLVDADVRTADTDIFLSTFGKHSILDLLNIGQKLDEDLLKSVSASHNSGITVLRGESRLQFLEEPIDPGQMSNLIEDLKAIWSG
jgi:pilus assembly protein CpaE